MTSKHKIEWTSAQGQRLAVWTDGRWCYSSVDGVESDGQLGPQTRDIPRAISDKGIVAIIGRVCMRQEQYSALQELSARMVEQYRQSPDGLRERRRALVDALAGAVEQVRYERERIHEDECGCCKSVPGYGNDPRIVGAERALAEFDRQHPEI